MGTLAPDQYLNFHPARGPEEVERMDFWVEQFSRWALEPDGTRNRYVLAESTTYELASGEWYVVAHFELEREHPK